MKNARRNSPPLSRTIPRQGLNMDMHDYVKLAAESRARELEAAINCFRECGVEIERFSIQEHPDMTALCIDGVPRFTWRIVYPTAPS
jgi:hypothetical protein